MQHDDPPKLCSDEPGLAACYAAATRGVAASGDRAGLPPLRLLVSPAPACSVLHESTEDHGRRAPASRSAEGASARRCRYITRPPLAQDRLELRPDGKLELTLKNVGKTAPALSCLSLRGPSS